MTTSVPLKNANVAGDNPYFGGGITPTLAAQRFAKLTTPCLAHGCENARKSSTNSSGCSNAAKVIARGIAARCVMLYQSSHQLRGARMISLGTQLLRSAT